MMKYLRYRAEQLTLLTLLAYCAEQGLLKLSGVRLSVCPILHRERRSRGVRRV